MAPIIGAPFFLYMSDILMRLQPALALACRAGCKSIQKRFSGCLYLIDEAAGNQLFQQ